jgi:hypothetical protein
LLESPVGKTENKIGIGNKFEKYGKGENRERKNRSKTLDDDVLQLIESCRRYQVKKLVFN